jgi:hypothetical protein
MLAERRSLEVKAADTRGQPTAVPHEDNPAALTDADRLSTDDPERYRAVHRALADELQLARLQAEVLVRLDEADQAGDDEAVLRCHAALDHVMDRIAEAERVRSGAQNALPGANDLICAGCGAAAGPVYQTPRLLGYSCTHCGWTGDDPAAQAEQRRAEARDAAAAVVERAVQGIADALVILDHRGRKARDECAGMLRGLRDDLTTVDGRLHRTELPGP